MPPKLPLIELENEENPADPLPRVSSTTAPRAAAAPLRDFRLTDALMRRVERVGEGGE